MAAHIAHCQQPSVKQEEHTKKGKEEPKGSKGNANLCSGAGKGCQAVNLASTHSCDLIDVEQSHCACRPACCMNCYGLLVHMTGSDPSSSPDVFYRTQQVQDRQCLSNLLAEFSASKLHCPFRAKLWICGQLLVNVVDFSRPNMQDLLQRFADGGAQLHPVPGWTIT